MKKATEKTVRAILKQVKTDPKAKAKIAAACWDLNKAKNTRQ